MILGASFDTSADNLAFAEAQRFDYQLLSDKERTVGAAYGVAKAPDEQYAEYAKRHAFLIDDTGMLRKTYVVTDVAAFAGDVLADLHALKN